MSIPQRGNCLKLATSNLSPEKYYTQCRNKPSRTNQAQNSSSSSRTLQQMLQALRRTFPAQLPRGLRFIGHGQLPEHAPGQDENEAWLDSLEVYGGSHDTTVRFNEEFEFTPSHDNLRTQFRFLPTDAGDPYMRLSIPFSHSTLRSSPFSNLSAKQRPKADNAQTFSDVRVLRLRSGKGGDGAVSFFRDAGRSIGPPDGGDGGRGGSIYIQAVEGITSLNKLKQFYQAGAGGNGKQRQLDGATGKDVLITVPVGTVIKWIPDPALLKESETDQVEVEVKAKPGWENESEPKYIQLFRESYGVGEGWYFKDKDKDEAWHQDKDYFHKLNKKVTKYDQNIINSEREGDLFPLHGVDLNKPSDSPVLLLKGGAGGLGNMHFLTNEVRNPRFSKRGRNYIEGHFLFELKILADLGLVGLPNAGKSTLLRAISNARPRVGHWAFTTLQPTIGTISLGLDKPSFTVADIPGLIKGASQNRGMGVDFLRHVERSPGLVFVVSLGNENPIEDVETLIEELDYRIDGKRVLVVATKADLEDTRDKFVILKDFVEKKEWKIVPISGLKQENIEQAILMMGECAGKL